MPRRWKWDALAALLFTVVSLVTYACLRAAHVPGSDGLYSWVYARSLAYDHDLDFTNDYGACGDPFGIGWTTPAGRPANFFYFGPAAFWTPVIWVLKLFVRHAADPVAQGCVGFVPTITLAMSSLAGGVVVLATSAILRRVVSPKIAALTSLVATLGGLVIYFTAMAPSYSHVYDAMCITVLVWALVRIRETEPTLTRLGLAGLMLGLAILQRSSNGVFALLVVAALWEIRSVAIVGVIAFFTGLLPLLLVNHAIYGRWLVYAHGPHFLHWSHAHPLLLLFDQRWGVFAWGPVLWLAVPGLVPLIRRRDLRWLVWPLCVCGAFELWSSSAALDYQGGRRLLNLTILAALAMSLSIARIARWLAARRWRREVVLGLALVSVVAWPNLAVAIGFATNKLPWDKPLTSAERYGEGERAVMAKTEESLGPLSALPAAWVYSLRYRRAPITFGWAAHPAWYARDMRTLEYQVMGFSFDASELTGLLRGFHKPDAGEACLGPGRGSVLFSAQWPFATRARLAYDATAPEKLTVTSRSFFGVRHAWGPPLDLPSGKQRKIFLTIPPGGFDSGMNELLFDHDGPDKNLCLRSLELVDDAVYPAAPEALASSPVTLWHASKYGDDATNPSLAVGSEPVPWTVEVHETSRGREAYSVNRAGELLDPHAFELPGFHPRVASAGRSRVVEIEQSLVFGGDLLCRVGHVTASGSTPALTWSERTTCGRGHHAVIAARGDDVAEVHTLRHTSTELELRLGKVGDTGITWGEPVAAGEGTDPALALDGQGHVVVATEKDVRVGRIEGGQVVWGSPVTRSSRTAPSLAAVPGGFIELHQETDSLVLETWRIAGDHIEVLTHTSYDHGARPVMAVDPTSGRGIESHEGTDSSRELWSHDADVRPW